MVALIKRQSFRRNIVVTPLMKAIDLRSYATRMGCMKVVRAHLKTVIWQFFRLGQRTGIDVLPRHYYSSIPNIRELSRTTEWRTPHTFVGVLGSDINDQARFLTACFSAPVRSRLEGRSLFYEACAQNGTIGYGPIEAEILYAFAVTHQPRKVVQVGAGVSTAILLSAASDFNFSLEIICIDPFPTPFLVSAAADGKITLVQRPAQDVDLDVLTNIGPGGLLFIDSTHTVRPGSEVNRLILEVLPRLQSGSYVHFHDITFPFDYPPDLLRSRFFFWEESALLLAFLTGNPGVSIAVSTSMLHHGMPQALAANIPNYHPMSVEKGIMITEGEFPSATYLFIP